MGLKSGFHLKKLSELGCAFIQALRRLKLCERRDQGQTPVL